jgi:hypothetical protein
MQERKKTYIAFLTASNRTFLKFTGGVKPLQELLLFHTMKAFIPNVLNDDLDFFFANPIALFLCQYKDIESSRNYSNHSTQLFNGDMSVNLCGVDLGSLISQSGKDGRSNLVTKIFFKLAEGLGPILYNRVHDQFRIYQ